MPNSCKLRGKSADFHSSDAWGFQTAASCGGSQLIGLETRVANLGSSLFLKLFSERGSSILDKL
jgi:hypothetical protein